MTLLGFFRVGEQSLVPMTMIEFLNCTLPVSVSVVMDASRTMLPP